MKQRADRQGSADWTAFWHLLKETEPIPGRYDVEWHGPYFISRPRAWHRSHFMLYGGHLYGAMEIGWSTLNVTWKIRSTELSFEGRTSAMGWDWPEQIWGRAIPQLAARLKSAIANPSAFNRRVQRLIPLEGRTGLVMRKWTWPKGSRPPLSRSQLEALETACRDGERSKARSSLSSDAYLELAGVMYDAAYPELRSLPPREKHSAKADTRHGGMLDLPQEDPGAFREWFASRAWSGSHPWEIVFGHPHGILFSPLLSDDGSWRFYLSVDTPGLYVRSVKMAIALGEAGVPFVLHEKDAVVATLRGLDDVEVGPGCRQLSLAQLQDARPDGVDRVRWDALPEIQLITPVQRLRVEHVLRTGSPAGWQAPAADHQGQARL